ncbi:MAG: gamma-glutamyltransferase, partial [Chloroflexota bacterium]
MIAARAPATSPARTVRGRHGAVASPHHLASQAGLAILRSGGSAVDAAITTNAALAVVAGHSCGLGGDAFWIIWDPASRAALALNGSGRSGHAASIEALRSAGHQQMPQRGPWSVTVPGAIDSWSTAHQRFGRLDWAALLAPAIDLATGFPAGPGWIEAVERAAVVFGVGGDWARTYRPTGRPWRPGEIVRLERLLETLRHLADDGAATAYTGLIGKRTVAYFAGAGVPIDASDL